MSTDQWEWIKWDANETFGSYAFGVQTPMTNLPIDFYQGQRPLLERVFENELFMNQYTSEICLLLNTVFNPEYLNPIIDNYKELIQQYVYADNNKMFSNNDFDTNINSNLGGPGGTIYGLKSFIQARYNYLSSSVNCNAFASLSSFIPEGLSAYPNPTTGSLIINGDYLYPLPYELFSLDGKCILRGELLNAEESIDISHLSSEMYHLKVGNKWIKVLKQ